MQARLAGWAGGAPGLRHRYGVPDDEPAQGGRDGQQPQPPRRAGRRAAPGAFGVPTPTLGPGVGEAARMGLRRNPVLSPSGRRARAAQTSAAATAAAYPDPMTR